jgi:hypothetical protein
MSIRCGSIDSDVCHLSCETVTGLDPGLRSSVPERASIGPVTRSSAAGVSGTPIWLYEAPRPRRRAGPYRRGASAPGARGPRRSHGDPPGRPGRHLVWARELMLDFDATITIAHIRVSIRCCVSWTALRWPVGRGWPGYCVRVMIEHRRGSCRGAGHGLGALPEYARPRCVQLCSRNPDLVVTTHSGRDIDRSGRGGRGKDTRSTTTYMTHRISPSWAVRPSPTLRPSTGV